MPSTAAVTNFDYAALDRDTASFVQEQTGEIRKRIRRTAQDIFEIGQRLLTIKEKLGHGNFLVWLKAEFAWDDRTANHFMNVARTFKSETVSDLPLAASALYILAAPSTPETVRENAIARAKSGEFISKKKAAALKSSHTDGQKKKAKPQDSTRETSFRKLEIIDAELEEFDSHTSPIGQETVLENEIISEKTTVTEEGIKSLPPSSSQLWRLSGKEQKHLLFNGNPDSTEFLARLPDRVGIWLSFPPSPERLLLPPKGRANTVFIYSTIYPNIDLKAVREAVERVLETSDESDLTAIVAYLPDPPLLVLLEDFQITCYIAEPDSEQCKNILSAWQQLGNEVEKLEKTPELLN